MSPLILAGMLRIRFAARQALDAYGRSLSARVSKIRNETYFGIPPYFHLSEILESEILSPKHLHRRHQPAIRAI